MGARIEFPTRRHIRMADHVLRRNIPGGKNAREHVLKACHQRFRKKLAPIIVQFNPDGAGIHICQPMPFACPRVPGPRAFAHQLRHPPGLANHVMRRHFGLRIAEPVNRRRSRSHCGIVQHDIARDQAILAGAKVGREMLVDRHYTQISRQRRAGTASDPNCRHTHLRQGPDCAGPYPDRPAPESRSGPHPASYIQRSFAGAWRWRPSPNAGALWFQPGGWFAARIAPHLAAHCPPALVGPWVAPPDIAGDYWRSGLHHFRSTGGTTPHQNRSRPRCPDCSTGPGRRWWGLRSAPPRPNSTGPLRHRPAARWWPVPHPTLGDQRPHAARSPGAAARAAGQRDGLVLSL
mmetsp:Transcript_27692/g.51508  ORF Transcript_27692/g.51508 Transcript_27692/m.51508 type:complete len:348 (-) Transcript_27692:1225-2268(-)